MRDNPPHDWENPDWNNIQKVHEWKGYPSDEVKSIWHSFSDVQKKLLAMDYDDTASNEHWD